MLLLGILLNWIIMKQLEFGQELIETVCIKPCKEIPLDVFKVFHRFSYYMELMVRIDANHVIWDEKATSIYCETTAQVLWEALQEDFFVMTMELPKKFLDRFMDA